MFFTNRPSYGRRCARGDENLRGAHCNSPMLAVAVAVLSCIGFAGWLGWLTGWAGAGGAGGAGWLAGRLA